MMRMVAFIAALAGLAVGACGSRVPLPELAALPTTTAVPAQASPAESGSSASATATAPQAAAPAKGPAAAAKVAPSKVSGTAPIAAAGASAAPAPNGATARPAPANELPVTVEVTPGCARPGQPVAVTARTAPGALIAIAMSFSDGESHGQYSLGEVPASGTFTWGFDIPVGAPPGDAQVMAGATGSDSRTGAGRADIRIVTGVCK
jgi:hypothetical protein